MLLSPILFFSMHNYVIFRCDRDLNGGGVAIYIRRALSPECLDFSCLLNLKSNVLCCKVPALQTIFVAIY